MGEPLLEIKELAKRFAGRSGRDPSPWVIRDLSFSVADGEFLTIIGPSGAGKTTLLNMIAQIDAATGGEVRFGSGDRADRRSQGAQARARLPHRLRDAGRSPAAVAHDAAERAVSARGPGTPEREDPRARRDADPHRRP